MKNKQIKAINKNIILLVISMCEGNISEYFEKINKKCIILKYLNIYR